MKTILKFSLPLLVLAAALIVATILFKTRPIAEDVTRVIKAPLVTVTNVSGQPMNIPVFTRGTVTPSTEIALVSEVTGQVLELSPNFANGGFFTEGEVLARVDPIEYEVNIKRAEASKAQAYQSMLQADAERKARKRVGGGGNAFASYEIQYQQARAQYEAAVAELEAAKMQKARAQIKAPFDGRVLQAALNVGQFLRPGQEMGVIYAVDSAEVRLPLSDLQLSLVDIPMRRQATAQSGPKVLLTQDFGGQQFSWNAELVRAEGGLDERNRLLYVIATVTDPYGVDTDQPGRPDLVAGSFVEATIAGRRFDRVFKVPRQALRNGEQLWTVAEDNTLEEKVVQIIYKSKDLIFVTQGLEDGDRVVLSQMDIAVEGMQVRTRVDESIIREGSSRGSAVFDQELTHASAPATSPPLAQNSVVNRQPEPTQPEQKPESKPKNAPERKAEPQPEPESTPSVNNGLASVQPAVEEKLPSGELSSAARAPASEQSTSLNQLRAELDATPVSESQPAIESMSAAEPRSASESGPASVEPVGRRGLAQAPTLLPDPAE